MIKDVTASAVANAGSAAVPASASIWKWGIGSLRRLVIRLVAVAAFAGLWQLASDHKSHFVINFTHVPAPTAVAESAADFLRSPKASRHVLSSLRRVAFGFGLAALIAVPLGLIIGRSRLAEDIILTPLEVLRPIPGVAWIPLAILMFPEAEQSMVFICVIGAIFPILLSTIHGVATIDSKLVYAAQTLGAKNRHIFCEIVFPGALPSIVTGLTIGMGTCWFLVVTAEMISGQFGIGYFTWEAYTLQNYADIVVGMLVIGLLGMASSVLLKLAGNGLMPWRRHAGQPE